MKKNVVNALFLGLLLCIAGATAAQAGRTLYFNSYGDVPSHVPFCVICPPGRVVVEEVVYSAHRTVRKHVKKVAAAQVVPTKPVEEAAKEKPVVKRPHRHVKRWRASPEIIRGRTYYYYERGCQVPRFETPCYGYGR
jgi:hypothetical protein